MYRLRVRAEVGGEEHDVDLARDVVLVGRRAGVDVLLPHADVGGVHLRLERATGARGERELVLVDGGAATGTWLNGARLAPGDRRELGDGDVIDVARRFHLTFVARSPAAEETSAPGTAALARAMVRDLLASFGSDGEGVPVLEIVAGPSMGKRLALPPPGRSVVIGRGETCDLALRDVDLSREHVRVHRDWTGVVVSDLGSKNGTRVAGVRLEVGVERRLGDGEAIEAGQTVIVLRDPAAAYLEALVAQPAPGDAPAMAPSPTPPERSAEAESAAPGASAAPAPPAASAPSAPPAMLGAVAASAASATPAASAASAAPAASGAPGAPAAPAALPAPPSSALPADGAPAPATAPRGGRPSTLAPTVLGLLLVAGAVAAAAYLLTR